MGIYLNPGKRAFQTAVDSKIYVDKTEMIQYMNSVLNTEQKYVCVSRPRRFGKTMAVQMLCAYYGRGAGSRSLFESLKISKCEPVQVGNRMINWDSCLERYNVIRIVMTDFIGKKRTIEEALDRLQKLVIRDLKKAYPEVDYFDETDLLQTMADVYETTQHSFVVVIDEWDSIFREYKDEKDGQKLYLDFLRDWLKNKDYIALAYMTGILPIKKYGKHSALNMFDEYSMIHPMQMAEFTGFTENEVKELCEEYGMLFESISDWYDGYQVNGLVPVEKRELYRKGEYKEQRISLYSPLSVVKAVTTGYVGNYWNKTETYEALAEYIRMDYDGLQETVALLMDGGRVRADLRQYQNDMTTFRSRDDVLALLIHLGYLGYDEETGEVFIPNKEILDEFKASTSTEDWFPVFAAFRSSLKLLEATWEQDSESVAAYLEKVHDQAENKTYNSEAALSYAIRLAYYSAQKYYTTILELDSGKGYADVVYLPSPKYPDKPALLIELKYGKTVKTAMDQIRARNYPERLEHYKGNLFLVSVNYEKEARPDDPDFKHHSCVIEVA